MSWRLSRKQRPAKPESAGDEAQKSLSALCGRDYKQVATSARQELARSNSSLAISGFAGGTFMGLSALGTAIALAYLGNSPAAEMVSRLFYPLGFIR